MARIITKELAVKIVTKLGAKKSVHQRKGAAHDLYDVIDNGILILTLSVRRGSEKDKGHDHMSSELFLGPNLTKKLGQCSLSKEKYFEILRTKGIIPTL